MRRAIPFILVLFMAVAACKKEDKDEEPVPQPLPVPTDTLPKDTVKPADSLESVVEISTPYGKMYMWLYKQTPKNRANFLKLAEEGYYNGTTFHRIVQGFVIQGGDPNSKDSDPANDGTGGPGYTIPFEFIDSLPHVRGSVGGASTAAKAPSNGSQFFINIANNTSLNKNYSCFGFIMKGIEVADSIVKQPKNVKDRPLTDIQMQVSVIKKTAAQIKTENNFTVK